MSVSRRFEVYVEIPTNSQMSALKRKPSSSDSLHALKKPKLVDTNANSVAVVSTDDAPLKKPAGASVEFPNGHLYCHQCAKKRDAKAVIFCTNTEKACKTKYCKPCMANRYGQDLEAIKSNSKAKPGAKLDYAFECPRCQGICNCRACRKAQGLEPTGNLTLAARKVGKSAAQLLDANPEQLGILPGKGQQTIPEKKPRNRAHRPLESGSKISSAPKTKRARVKRPRPSLVLSQPKWSPAPVPSRMPYADLESRIFIREFMMRFSSIIDREAKAHLDELAEIAGDGTTEEAEDDDDNSRPLVSWVSEGCIKSIFIGLLSLLADCASPTLKKSWITDALKNVKSSSANLTKVWMALAILRDQLEDAKILSMPQPLPPPASMPVCRTRRGAADTEGIQIGRSAQFIPIIVCLMEDLLVRSKAIKTEIDNGSTECKEIFGSTKETITQENERWKLQKEKAGGKPGTEAREAHKRIIQDLEEAQKLLAYGSTARFGPLGTDDEGRVYYALTPGLGEREAAAALIYGESQSKRSKKIVGGVSSLDEKERESLTSWSWFVAVWGKKPAGAVLEDEEELDDGEEKWWGFSRPQQIKELAQWIASKHGLDGVEEDDVEVGILGAAVSILGVESDVASSVGDAMDEDSSVLVRESPWTDAEDDDDEDGLPLVSVDALRSLIGGLDVYATLLDSRIKRA